MSHTTTVQPTFKSPTALKRACEELDLKFRMAEVDSVTGKIGEITQCLYDTVEVGWATVQLPGWNFPIVFREDGKIAMDNYEGQWGKLSELDRLQQCYSKHAVLESASAQGMVVAGEPAVTADGSLVFELQY